MSRLSRSSLVVYDSDGVNPYGRELASVLHDIRTVVYCCPRATTWVPERLATHRILGSSVKQDGFASHMMRRVLAPLSIIIACLVTRRGLVIAWTRGWWDAILFAMAAPLMRYTIVVNHNPSSVRGTEGWRSRGEQFLKRRVSMNVVHSQALLASARQEADRVSVVPHPPYAEWAKQFFERAETKGGVRALAFVGSLRADKGSQDFVRAVGAMRTRPLQATFVGRGELDASLVQELWTAGVRVELPADHFLTDGEFAARLAAVDLVLAPYSAVTQSGSVIMALTVGLGVIAFRGGGVTELLTPESLIDSGDVSEMARRAEEYLSDPWVSGAFPTERMLDMCRHAWGTLLQGLGR